MASASEPTAPHHGPVTVINVFEIPAEQVDKFIAWWRTRAQIMAAAPGFRDARLHRAVYPRARFQLVNVAHWDSKAAHDEASASGPSQDKLRALREDPQMRAFANPAIYEVVAELGEPPEPPRGRSPARRQLSRSSPTEPNTLHPRTLRHLVPAPPARQASRSPGPLPQSPAHPPSRPPRPREITRAAGRTHAYTRPTRRQTLSQGTPRNGHRNPRRAATHTAPWPRFPSAMRPWTPQHSALQRYKVTHAGTEKKRPAFTSQWPGGTDHAQLAASFSRFIATHSYDLANLRTDLARFTFLLGYDDGEQLFGTSEN